MDPSTPLEPPPPAYALEQEYDRKISDALERSLSISSNQAQQPSNPAEEEWEDWDEAQFEAAARAREQGVTDEQSRPPISHRSSEKERLARQDACQAGQTPAEASSPVSSGSGATPASTSRRRLPSSPPAKERPSWFAEAQLDTPAGSGSNQSNQTPSTLPVHHIPPEEEYSNEPPPPFAPVGPSLEGPPFEEIVREPLRLPPISDADSPPQSPLDSVDESDVLSEPPSFSLPPGRRTYSDNHYRSTPPREAPSPAMLRTTSFPSSSPRPPPMRFDPSVAYARQRALGAISAETEPKEAVDASAFYNSTISSLLAPSQQPQAPKKNLSHSSSSDALARFSTYRSSAQDSYSQAPQAPQAFPPPPPPHNAPLPCNAPFSHNAPLPQNPVAHAPNPYYPVQGHAYAPAQTQYAPYSQPQQPQQAAPAFYGQPFQGAVPGPQPQWPPPNNMYGGGYGR